MTMLILIIMVLLMGYLVILIRDLQTDAMNLRLAIENVMKKFDNTIGRLDKIKIPKKEDIKEDQVDRLPRYVKINNKEERYKKLK